MGCYKVILDCSVENKAFYEKCGFQQKSVQMAMYFAWTLVFFSLLPFLLLMNIYLTPLMIYLWVHSLSFHFPAFSMCFHFWVLVGLNFLTAYYKRSSSKKKLYLLPNMIVHESSLIQVIHHTCLILCMKRKKIHWKLFLL